MVTLTQSASPGGGNGYVAEFLCRDSFGAFEVGAPKVQLLKDL